MGGCTGFMSLDSTPDTSSVYERLQQVNKAKNQELASIAEDIERGKRPQVDPFFKLQNINKKQYQEYLKYTNERDRNKSSAEAIFANGPRLMLLVVFVVVVGACVAYMTALSKL